MKIPGFGKDDGNKSPSADEKRKRYELVIADLFKTIGDFQFRNVQAGKHFDLIVHVPTDHITLAEKILKQVIAGKSEIELNSSPDGKHSTLRYKVTHADLEKIEAIVKQHPDQHLPFADENLAAFDGLSLSIFPAPVNTGPGTDRPYRLEWEHPYITLRKQGEADRNDAARTTLTPDERNTLLVTFREALRVRERNRQQAVPLQGEALDHLIADTLEVGYFAVERQRAEARLSR